MGRGKSWSRDESKAVAKAWKVASALPEFSSTRDHNSKRFAAHLYQCFIKLTPNHADPASLDGRWTFRSQTAVKTQFDAIADDILKFNLVLLAVRDSILPPVSAHPPDPRLLRAAIAVHLGAAPRHHIDLDAVDTIESDWKLFEAWTILKTCPRFAPNPAPSDLSSFPENANTSNNNNNNNNNNNTNNNNNNNNTNNTTTNNNNNNNNNNPPPSSSVPHTPTKSLPSGNTPMRTLASAALSMPHVPAVPSHPSPSSSRSRSRSPSPKPNPNSTHHPYRPMRTRSRRLRDPAVSAVHFRPVGPPAKPVKRRLTPVPADHLDHNHVDQPDQHDHHSLNDDDQHQHHHNHDNHDDNSPSLPRRRPLPKAPRLSTCNLAASSGAIEMVGHALRSLGDALSEYNAITLFSRPDMQGRQDQKLFFNTLAEKHVLKAKRDRDQLAAEVQRVREGSDKSNT